MLQEQPLNDMESDGYTQCRVLDGADKVSEIRKANKDKIRLVYLPFVGLRKDPMV